MASTRKPRSSELPARIETALARHVPAGARLTLGLSGGIDSIVLLDVLAQCAPRHPFLLSCLHVNHGISPHAAQWAEFACASAAHAGCECVVRQVRLDEHPGLGLEGAARAARYAVFAECDTDFVVFAHQQDDQAETLLLQLVRGAGVAGLAGMPVVRPFSDHGDSGMRTVRLRLLRPMLDSPRSEIEAYARERGLRWVEDESNADTGLARNFVRDRVMPLLRALNPAASANIARSAAHLADALELVQTIATQDLCAALRGDALDLAFVRTLDEPRARNLLRAWLDGRGVVPSTVRLREAQRQLLHAGADAAMAVDFGTHRLCRYADRAYLIASAEEPCAGYEARWTGVSPWPLPELGGRLRFTAAVGRGIAAAAVRPGALVVRLRQGGERFQPDARRPRRELKKLFQERGVAPWVRDRLPLLYCDGRLACVPGIGVAHDLQPAPGEAGVSVEWLPDAR